MFEINKQIASRQKSVGAEPVSSLSAWAFPLLPCGHWFDYRANVRTQGARVDND